MLQNQNGWKKILKKKEQNHEKSSPIVVNSNTNTNTIGTKQPEWSTKKLKTTDTKVEVDRTTPVKIYEGQKKN